MAKVKHVESDIDEEELEGSMEADTGELSRYKKDLKQTTRVSNRVKGRRFDGKKLDVDETGDNLLDDLREACSGTEGQRFGAARYTDGRVSKPSPQGPRKRSKKALFKRGMNTLRNFFPTNDTSSLSPWNAINTLFGSKNGSILFITC